jgi:hypothetical protein
VRISSIPTSSPFLSMKNGSCQAREASRLLTIALCKKETTTIMAKNKMLNEN